MALTICAQPGQSSLPRKWVWTNEISYLSSGVIAWNAVLIDFADMDSTFRNVWSTKARSSAVGVIITSSILLQLLLCLYNNQDKMSHIDMLRP